VTRRQALLGLSLATACATTPKPRPRPGSAPPPDLLLAALRRRQGAVQSIELETRTTSWLGGERLRATVLMMVDRRGRLRFDAEAPVQGHVASLAVSAGQFALLDDQKHVFETGPACPANVASMIRIPLEPDEVAAILLGDAPADDGARAAGVEWDGVRGADVLVVERPAVGRAATRLWIALRPTASGCDVLGVEGQSPWAADRWRVAYDDLAAADGGTTLPRRIRFAEPGKGFDDGVEIKVNERLGLNRPLPDQAFALAAPSGYQVRQLPCPP
jgi:hypothetical protein